MSDKIMLCSAGKRLRILCACLCFLLFSSCASQTQSLPALLTPIAAPADLVPVSRGDVRQRTMIEAAVKPYSEGLYFMQAGVSLLKIHVEYGQDVAEGDILAELDITDYLEKLDALRETLAHNERSWAHDNKLSEIEIEMAELESTQTRYESELKKYSLQSLKDDLELAKDLQELERAKLKARIAEMESQRDGYYLKAPYDGKVLYITNMQPGGIPGVREPIIYLGDMSRMRVECSGTYLSTIRGAISLFASVGGQNYAVEEIPYTIEEYMAYYYGGGTPPVRFAAKDEGVIFAADQQVFIHALGKEQTDTLWLPPNAVRSEETNVFYAYTDENGVRVRRGVKIGLRTGTRVEILDGLAEGEMVYAD